MKPSLQLGLTSRGLGSAIFVAAVGLLVFGLLSVGWNSLTALMRTMLACIALALFAGAVNHVQERLEVRPHLVRRRRLFLWREWEIRQPEFEIDLDGYFCIIEGSTRTVVVRLSNVYREYWEEIERAVRG